MNKESPCKDCKWYDRIRGVCTHKEGARLEEEKFKGSINCNQFEFK